MPIKRDTLINRLQCFIVNFLIKGNRNNNEFIPALTKKITQMISSFVNVDLKLKKAMRQKIPLNCAITAASQYAFCSPITIGHDFTCISLSPFMS